MPDRHSTFFEQLIFALACIAKAICALAVVWVFFTPEYLPACNPEALLAAPVTSLYAPIAVLAVGTAYFSTYGTNWTPAAFRYEGVDALFALIFAGPLAWGVYEKWDSMSELQTFTALVFGGLAAFMLFFDWIGRGIRYAAMQRRHAAAGGP